MKTANEIINKYLSFGGKRISKDFTDFLREIVMCKAMLKETNRDYVFIQYIHGKISYGFEICKQYEAEYGSIDVVVDEESKEDIEYILKKGGYLSGVKPNVPKRVIRKPKKREPKTPPKRKGGKKKDLGKIVDQGKVAPDGNSDVYWGRNGMDVVFLPNDEKVRIGETIPANYKYTEVRFLEGYYGLRAIEFGNWLSQQDRFNYLSGFGLAMFDLHKAIDFEPKQIGIAGKLSVAFGARGRGRALAHFEQDTFAINLTRYSRPDPVKERTKNFKRVNKILTDGGVGSFAHEYGHALDYYAGLFIQKGKTSSLSGDRTTRTEPDAELLKKTTVRGLMEKLLSKIIWKSKGVYSEYYTRMTKTKIRKYFIQRNEIFARSFEVYVQYKLAKSKYKNVFLNHVKYPEKFYLTIAEMKKLEKDYDALIDAIKKHL